MYCLIAMSTFYSDVLLELSTLSRSLKMKKIILCLTLLFCLPSLRAMDIAESSESSEQRSAEDNKVLLSGQVRQANDITVVAISLRRLPRKSKKNLYEAQMADKIADLEKRVAALEKSMGVKTDNYGKKRKAKKQ